jgi:outer membrane protein assembly factor BamB
MTLIELGYVDADSAAPPDPPLDRGLTRRVGAAIVLVLCLATLTASVRPTPHGLVLLWSIPQATEANFAVAGDSVFVLGGPNDQTLTGYALADGAKRWSRELPDPVPYIDASDPHVLLLPTAQRVVSFGNDAGSHDFYTETVALDAATGTELWRSPGSGSGWPATGTALLEDRSPDGGGTARLRLVRLADGATVWSRETPGVQRWITLGVDPDHPDRIATVTGDGDVRVLRLADGTDTAGGTVEWDAGSPAAGDFIDLAADGDALYVLRTTRFRSTATAYSAFTLRRLWTAQQPGGNGAYPCGAVLCIGGIDELFGYDWVTGAVRWRARGLAYAMTSGHDLLLAEGTAGAQRSLLDDATGRRIADLGSTRPIWNNDGDSVITLGASQTPTGRTVVRQVDPRSGETFLLGTMDPVADQGCTLADRFLLCTTILPGRLTVTAVG